MTVRSLFQPPRSFNSRKWYVAQCVGKCTFDKEADLLRVVEKYGEAFEDGLAALEYGQGVKAFEKAYHVLGDGDQEEIDRLFANGRGQVIGLCMLKVESPAAELRR
jgi:hypothetical protein